MTLEVETSGGRIVGGSELGIHAFRGIPYAAAPVGERRFRPAEKPTPWAGVREARGFGDAAPQNTSEMRALPGMEVGPQSEDCLHLNVYTPGIDAARRPVMVWIHGGAFTGGSGGQAIYEGAALARRGDVVVVTLNYRLGALGFLDLESRFGEAFRGSANAGLSDQLRALEWVRENIDRFGGDPGQVTIFGESAGGMSVSTLFGCEAAQGLFQRAIPQSGAAHNTHDREAAERICAAFLSALGSSEPAALRDAPLEAILAAQFQCVMQTGKLRVLLPFQPCEGDALLPLPPLEAVRRGVSGDRPLLTGATREEWGLFAAMDPGLSKLDGDGFARRVGARVPEQHVEALVAHYRERLPEGDAARRFCAFETDRVFRVPALRLADAQCVHDAPVHLYDFAWASPARRGALGACHAIELPFVFGTLEAPGMARFCGSGPEAEVLSGHLMDSWLRFARNGDPAHSALPPWPRVDAARRDAMVFDRELRVEPFLSDADLAAWEGVL